MSKPTKCPKCGAALSSRQINGLCPKCIAKVTLGLKRPQNSKRSQQASTDNLTPGGGSGKPTPGTKLKKTRPAK